MTSVPRWQFCDLRAVTPRIMHHIRDVTNEREPQGKAEGGLLLHDPWLHYFVNQATLSELVTTFPDSL